MEYGCKSLVKVNGMERPENKHYQGGGMVPDTQSTLLTELRALLNDSGGESVVSLRELVDNLPVAICYVDADEIVRFVNREFERWYSEPRSQIIGRTLRDITGDDERYFASHKRVRTALQGYKTRFFLPRPYPDGQTRYVCAYLEPDITTAGKVMGYVAVLCPVPLSGDEAKHIFDDRGFRRIGNDT
jgi:PAS domain S-box-containing protein